MLKKFLVIKRQASTDLTRYPHSGNEETEAEKGKGGLAKFQNQSVRDLSLEPCCWKLRPVSVDTLHTRRFTYLFW